MISRVGRSALDLTQLPSTSAARHAPAKRSAAVRPRAASHRVRSAALVVHRWVGLLIAGFLLVAGITGSIIAFFGDLDAALNPELLRVAPPVPGAPLLDPLALHARIQAQQPSESPPLGALLDLREGESVNYSIGEREHFFDPYTGRALGSRRFGDLAEGKKNVLTFIYRLHYSLGLGDVGMWLFGIVALLWTIDCFVGAYLTFPVAVPAARGATRSAWLTRWAPAWLLKTQQLFSLVFTWHRASGLWIWGMLLVFAWSAVALNLGEQVYQPVMRRILPGAEPSELPQLDAPRPSPRLDYRAALERGRSLMARETEQRQFRVIREKALDYDAATGAYSYNVESTLDIDERLADTTLLFDGDAGQPLEFHSPTTDGARTAVDRWLIALHFGSVREGGIVYRAFVSLLGLAVATLSVTGVWIWWRKRSKRAPRRAHQGAVAAARNSSLRGEMQSEL